MQHSLRGIVSGCSGRGVAGALARCCRFPVVQAAAPCLAPQPSRRALHVSAVAYAPEQTAPTRTYTQFSIYKGKSAVAFKAIPPTFRQSGQYANYTLEREGALFMEFALANAGQAQSSAPGTRSYDWSNKVTFAVRPLELAQLTDVDNLPDVSKGVELFHDPNKGGNNPGAARTSKKLRLAYNPQGDGYLLNMTQNKEGAATINIMVPVSRAEFVVLKHLAGYLIPRMLGFDMLFEGAGAAPSNITANGDGGMGGGADGNGAY